MKQKIKHLVASGKTEEVINLLLGLTSKSANPGKHNEVVILSNHYQEHLRNKALGITDAAEQRRISAQINQSLLILIDRIEDADFSDFTIEQKTSSGGFNYRKVVYLLGGVMIAAFFIVLVYDKIGNKPEPQQEISSTPSIGPMDDISKSPATSVSKNAPKKEKPVVFPEKPISLPSKEIKPEEVFKGKWVQVTGDSIQAFKIAAHEVTIEQYLLFCKLNNYGFPKEVDTTNTHLPITWVSWKDAVAYCEFIGARLPTVKEWVYAATGGNKSQNFKFSGSNSLQKVAWSNIHDSISGPQPVGGKAPNELGLFDMSGNVREWCNDKTDTPNYYPVKGGGWKSKEELYYSPLKNLKPEPASFRDSATGFRVVFDR
jgi:formylglycine-generating enzyme required for sulfatase activity